MITISIRYHFTVGPQFKKAAVPSEGWADTIGAAEAGADALANYRDLPVGIWETDSRTAKSRKISTVLPRTD